MNKESASRVRIERPTVNNRQGDDTDSTGPTHARTRRHLWLWPSPVPPQLCLNLGDDGLRRAAYRGGWKPA